MTISQAASTTWCSRTDDTPASLAAVYREAAALIRQHGYSPCATAADAGCYSAASAIEFAAGAGYDYLADQADAAEEALTRFAGYLYLTGLARRRTSVYDITDTAAGQWEACRPGEGYRAVAEVLAVLDGAAAMLDGAR